MDSRFESMLAETSRQMALFSETLSQVAGPEHAGLVAFETWLCDAMRSGSLVWPPEPHHEAMNEWFGAVLPGIVQTYAKSQLIGAGLSREEAIARLKNLREFLRFLEVQVARPKSPQDFAAERLALMKSFRDLSGLPLTRVVAGMATVRGNTDSLVLAMRSILSQVDHLYLYLNDSSEAPKELGFSERVTIHVNPDGAQFGDAGKFHGLEQCADNVIYFTCDDDIIYPPDYVSTLIRALAETRGRAVVGVHGAMLRLPMSFYYSPRDRSTAHFAHALPATRRVQILGTGTTAFHTSSVKPAMAEFKRANMADIWLATYCHRARVPLVCVSRDANWLRPIPNRRPSIFESSSKSRGDRCDTGQFQTAVLNAHEPLSTLAAAPPPPNTSLVLLRTRTGPRLPALLSRLAAGRGVTVFFLFVDDDGALNADASLNHEVHVIRRSASRGVFDYYVGLVRACGVPATAYHHLEEENAPGALMSLPSETLLEAFGPIDWCNGSNDVVISSYANKSHFNAGEEPAVDSGLKPLRNGE